MIKIIQNPDIDYEKDGDGEWNDFAIWADGDITCGWWPEKEGRDSHGVLSEDQSGRSVRVWRGRRPPTDEQIKHYIYDRHNADKETEL